MTIGNSSLPYLRVRIVSRFPAVVQGANGTKVEKANGVFTIGPSTGDLMEVASVPDDAFVQVWGEQSDSYARIPASAFVGGGGGGAVNSVNGKTGTVVLVASDIAGVGDMTAAVYDPNSIAADAFDMANMVEGTTAKILTATERTKLAGVATGATANSSDATLLARANHTGTQSADTLTDGTTNKAFLATERTKLSGVATGATANSADATLLARANHTGTQAASTITGLGTVATTNAYSDLTGLPTLGNVAALNYAASTTTFLRNDGTWATPPGGGGGGGDMYAAVYDPNGVADDAFDMDNMAEGTTAKVFTATERTKLTGVATGATANDTDANLKARANHTGTQTASTISDFSTAADARISAAVGVSVQAYDADLTTWAGITPATGVGTFLATPSSANLRAALTDETGTGVAVFATSPTLVTPNLGTPSAATLTNATGLPVATGVSGLGAGVATFLATPSSANLAAAVTGETGSGALVFATSPTLVTPVLGAASATSLTLTTDLAIADGGTGASTASAAFTALKQDATTSATGVVELATAAEFRALTSGKAIDTDAVSGGMAEATLTDAATVAWVMSDGFDFTVTLGGNRTLGNPSGTTVGKRGRIRVVQDGTGTRTLALSSNLKTAGGAGITLSTAAGAVDYLDYDCVSSTNIRIALSKAWA